MGRADRYIYGCICINLCTITMFNLMRWYICIYVCILDIPNSKFSFTFAYIWMRISIQFCMSTYSHSFTFTLLSVYMNTLLIVTIMMIIMIVFMKCRI
jgi:hypothetical protein